MSKKENLNNGNGASLGEISTIRDILMGQHINDFESKFKSMQDKMKQMEDKINEKMKNLSADLKSHSKDLSSETTSHLARFEDQTVGQLLMEAGKSLMKS